MRIKCKKSGAILAWVLGIFAVLFIICTLVGSSIISTSKFNESYNDTNDMDNALNAAINIGAYYYKCENGVKENLSKEGVTSINVENSYINKYINKSDVLKKFNYNVKLMNTSDNIVTISATVKSKDNIKTKEGKGTIEKVIVSDDKN